MLPLITSSVLCIIYLSLRLQLFVYFFFLSFFSKFVYSWLMIGSVEVLHESKWAVRYLLLWDLGHLCFHAPLSPTHPFLFLFPTLLSLFFFFFLRLSWSPWGDWENMMDGEYWWWWGWGCLIGWKIGLSVVVWWGRWNLGLRFSSPPSLNSIVFVGMIYLFKVVQYDFISQLLFFSLFSFFPFLGDIESIFWVFKKKKI